MILKKLDRLPPFLVRLLARKKNQWRHPLSTTEIAELSGLPRSTVAKIATMKSWDKIPVGVADRFSTACNVNLMTPGFYFKELRSSKFKFAHLRNGTPNQRAFFARLMDSKA